MHNLIFATLAAPGQPELDILLLAKSIRTFGGEFSTNPIWVFTPTELGSLSEPTQEKLTQMKAKNIPFDVDPEILKFPFAVKTVAAACIEAQTLNQTERLVFMDRDTIVLQEPVEFLIATDRVLGYRPVHHKLIGPAWDKPLDSFWQLVYEVCDVPDDVLFPMMSHTGEQIRPYFNAGMFIIRPERGSLTHWQDTFLNWYRQPQFKAYYEKDQRYAIFIHQAIFTGILLQNLKPEEMVELSSRINYPLHLHSEIPEDQRPSTINELITVRYESIFDTPDWEELPIMEPIRSWLEAQPRFQKSP
jgi:hypothetical protein